MIGKPTVIVLLLATASVFAQEVYRPQPPVFSGPPSALGHSSISNSEVLRTNEYIVSNNKEFVLIMQPDGNLCEYFGSSTTTMKPGALWCSNAVAPGGRWSLVFGTDGNMCVCPGEERGPGAIWCSNKLSNAPSFAMLADDGNLAVYTGTPAAPGALVWQTGNFFSKVAATAPAAGGTIQWQDGTACPPDCAKILKVGTTVSLTARPTAPAAFASWGGSCAGQATTICQSSVQTGGLQNVSASFGYEVKVDPPPVGGVVRVFVVSLPDGNAILQFACNAAVRNPGQTIAARDTCSKVIPAGSRLLLSPSPFNRYENAGWTGDCANRSFCDVTALNGPLTFSAKFTYLCTNQDFGGGSTWYTCPPGVRP